MASLPLPDFLFDTHKRYKADTNRVAQWLAETAQKCGFDLGTQPATQPRPSGRLKGKARKEARLATPKLPEITSTSHIVTVKGFTDMAQFIVQQTPAIAVPETILGLLRSAISLRHRCSSWFRKLSTQEGHLRESDDKHSHFIGVLETVLEILEPHSRPAASQSDVRRSMEKMSLNAKSKVPAEEYNNPYDVLFIEEDSVPETPPTLEPRPKVPPSKPRVPPTPPVRYEMEATDEEIYFGVFCFFADLNELKGFLHDIWTRYKAGSCDLITASVTTNCAFELAQRAEKDFVTLFPKCDTFKKMSSLIYDSMCISRGQPVQPKGRPDKAINTRMMDVAEWLFMRVGDIIDLFLPLIEPNKIPAIHPQHSYDHSRPRSKLTFLQHWQEGDPVTFRQQLLEDQVMMSEALVDFYLYHYVVEKGVPVTDKLVDGFQLMFTDKIVRAWVAFCAQVFLDIQHVLREDIERGFTELQASATQAKSTLTEYFTTSQIFQPNWPKFREDEVKFVESFVDVCVISDPVKLCKPPEIDYRGSHRLLRRNPLLSGLYQFKLHLLMQETGMNVTNAYGSILFVTHLYEACRQGGYSDKTWPDIELIMDIHTREEIFAGRVPKTPEDALRTVMLAMGVSPVTFAGDRRDTIIRYTKQGAKALSFNSPVMDLLRGRYSGDANTPLTLETVEALLEDRAVTSTTVQTTPSVDGQRENVLRQQWNKSHKLTVLQLLETLRDATAAEQYMLRFDYFALHRRCLSLLRKLRELLGETLRQYQTTRRPEHISQTAAVVQDILKVARGTAHAGVYAGDELEGGKSKVMKQASEVVDEFIRREGRVERKKLVKMRAVSLPT